MNEPSVAIIVLTWNNQEDTCDCLASLQSLKYPNHQIVLVDNGSTDGTVSKIRLHYPEIVIIENGQNLGYAEGNNVGIRYALTQETDYILILNNDTVVDPLLLNKLVLAAQTYPKAGVFSPKIYWHAQPTLIWFAGAKWIPERACFFSVDSGEVDHGQKSEAVCETDYACGCALFFRSEIASKTGLFDPRFFLTWEEADWCYRVRRQGYDIMTEPKAKIWHKVSRSFENEYQGSMYHYYYSRNRWLWIERNLRGVARIKAFRRCLYETYHCIRNLRMSKSLQEQALLKAKILGSIHYFRRQFGPGPKFASF